MKTSAECRAYAAQCRDVAKGMSEQHCEQALEMADVWESLAREADRADSPKKQIAQRYARQKHARN